MEIKRCAPKVCTNRTKFGVPRPDGATATVAAADDDRSIELHGAGNDVILDAALVGAAQDLEEAEVSPVVVLQSSQLMEGPQWMMVVSRRLAD